jgi:hypothetical protein
VRFWPVCRFLNWDKMDGLVCGMRERVLASCIRGAILISCMDSLFYVLRITGGRVNSDFGELTSFWPGVSTSSQSSRKEDKNLHSLRYRAEN